MLNFVCIVSEQAVPNLLFIRQFREKEAKFFFLSSKEMEERKMTKNIKAALRLPENRCFTVLIDANDAMVIFQQLQNYAFPKEGKYLVNITGGNKLMSQMVFQYFMDFDSEMLYAPIGSPDYQVLYPEVGRIPKDNSLKLSLDDYLRAYGYKAESSLDYYELEPSPSEIMRQLLQRGHPKNVDWISRASHQDYKKEDKRYLMGEWFELYCFKLFKELFNLDNSQIACSVGVKSIESDSAYPFDNEFDLMFVYLNDLYVFECKVYLADVIRLDKISPPIFKLASLSQNFGLQCKKFIAVLGQFSDDQKSLDQLENLRLSLGINKILDQEVFANSKKRKYFEGRFAVQA
ncbi:hypothetical protein A3SI_19832 [Nitritalea halalkaliphila LW7]|uniref:DUF1887 family protein n=1 Tax=Nitritalea halalkaliphila LW7 TaxID=1189621 RepID=I5BRW6_9BACT|nr:DUF1887 family CARF protein [Nitritalea halalkaliphila]EIM72318.1 hypothetical protein A3SI_19832 [Nitritalea halalkaliphila LW7]